jgi:4-hydroxybenzoate polyprenyltransferase
MVFKIDKIIPFLKNLNELVVFTHTIFALPFVFISMIVAKDGWFGWELLILGSFAAIFARNFAMSYNRYVDMDIDKKNSRTSNRPSVDGRISTTTLKIFILINAILFIFVAFLINQTALYLSFAMLFIIGGYSHVKRFSYMAHIVLGLSLALAPIAGSIAVSGDIFLWTVFLSSGVIFWVAGFDLLYSIQDIKFDKTEKLHSIPAKYGKTITLNISKIFHILTLIFWLLFAYTSDGEILTYFAISIIAILLIIEHIIINKDFTKIDKAFFTINGYISILFLIFIILGKSI